MTRRLLPLLLALATALGLTAPSRAADFYSQNFDLLTVGSTPAGWTNIDGANFVVANSGAISGSNAFGEASPSGSNDVCLYTGHAATGDGQVYFDFVAVATDPTHYTMPGVVLRSDSTYTNAYLFAFGIDGSGNFNRKSSGGVTSVGMTGTWPSLTPGSRYSLRCEARGNVLSAKVWPYGTAEPGSWQVTTTDSGLSGVAGYCGLRVGGLNSTAAVTVDNLSLDDIAPVVGVTPFVSGSGQSIGIRFDVAGTPVNVYTVNPSGTQPTYKRNGGSSTPLPAGFWGKGRPASGPIAPYLPFYLAPLPATTPTPRRFGCGEGNFSSASFAALGSTPPSYSSRPYQSSTSGAAVTWKVEGNVPGDTVSLAVRWPTDATLSNAARFQLIDGSFTVLATFTVDESVATTADVTEAGFAWHTLGSVTIQPGNRTLYVQLTSQGNKVAVDAVRLARAPPDNSVAFAPSDTGSVSFPDGWISVLYNGSPVAVPGVTDLALANHSGGSILPASPASTTMALGFNVEPEGHGSTSISKSDLFGRVELPLSGAATSDAASYLPTSLSAQSVGGINLASQPGDDGGHGQGLRYLPNGYYAVSWTGPDTYDLEAGSNTDVNEVVGLRQANYRVFNCQGKAGLQVSPSINLRLTSAASVSGGTYAWGSSAPKVYPPHPSDPTGLTPWFVPGGPAPPRFHPSYLAHLAGAKSLRFLDPLGSNGQYIHEIDDATQRNTVNVGVARIETPGVTDQFFDKNRWCVAKVTLASPVAALFDGCLVQLHGCGTATMTGGGSPVDLSVLPIYGSAYARMVSSTVLYIQIGTGGNGTVAMANVLTPGSGTLTAVWSGYVPIREDYIALCNQVGADCYLNIPTCLSDRSATLLGTWAATTLSPGLKLRLEYSNEPWNSGFYQYYWLQTLAYRVAVGRGDPSPDDLNNIPGYVSQAKHTQALIIAAWTAAGRNPGDVVTVFGTAGGNPGGYTLELCNEIVRQSAPMGLLVVGPYVSNSATAGGSEPDLADVTDGMTAPVCGDLLELMVLHGGWGSLFYDAHRAYLDSHAELAGTPIGAYEMAWNALTPFGSSADGRRRTHQMLYDPRMGKYWTPGLLKHCQDHGGTIAHFFYLSGGSAFFVATDIPSGWDVYTGFDQPDGTGTLGENPDPDDAANRKSEIGGAIRRWNALLSPPSTPPVPIRNIPPLKHTRPR